MDLHSGYPYWLIRNGLLAEYPALTHNLPDEEIVIIGSGISGALAAHELCKAGFRCTILDKRLLAAGSTWASTAQLNYEIDASMLQLAKWYGEEQAAMVYHASFQSVNKVQDISAEIGLMGDGNGRSSIYLASDRNGKKEAPKEAAIRQKHGLPVSVLDRDALQARRIMQQDCALYHQHAFQFDAYQMTARLIQHNVAKGNLKVYTRTCVEKLASQKDGVVLETSEGYQVRCRFVVCAPGYESAQFLPRKVMDLHATYALVTQPLPEEQLWKERSLIWETKRPYFYCRTTTDNRIMMGGEDVPFRNPKRRDALMGVKEEALLKHCRTLFPHLHINADFVWCGTFGESPDGLPYIGRYPGIDHVFFALGYGGNGTTYSTMAAEMARNHLTGVRDEREQLFGFDRKRK
ncbi:Glycine/D-amino acid oxidase [Cnuella takakiae]|uniref:Glycine/D-amino acid oxidase n=1 Tax=Cnuella takakiae TaxID=1302690 RepID=A0A1M5IXV9_9BACT|nr:FAD-binding oxidoreductase [Cnuella takakiae]OLY91419.1 hypothetical protein BUE76_05520 [Cnuella takakiae]SHG33101.1 Glycine/D-amino acid oxidase [Cnuella takakiae]